tara:strand:+ start:1280 stop:1885 length:606 start_codon:yes stop_codon:yes gene_type:complete
MTEKENLLLETTLKNVLKENEIFVSSLKIFTISIFQILLLYFFQDVNLFYMIVQYILIVLNLYLYQNLSLNFKRINRIEIQAIDNDELDDNKLNRIDENFQSFPILIYINEILLLICFIFTITTFLYKSFFLINNFVKTTDNNNVQVPELTVQTKQEQQGRRDRRESHSLQMNSITSDTQDNTQDEQMGTLGYLGLLFNLI